MNETLKLFTAYDVQSCLYDTERVELFRRAIAAAVKPGATVIDGGSGTGLLGLLAAKAGAAKVYCVEINADFIDVMLENARRNGVADRIIPVHADATQWISPDPADVIISEVISAGFFYEPQLQIINNLLVSLKPGGRVIPLAMENSVELISAQDHLYGLRFDFDSRYRVLPDDRPLTDAVPYLSTNFHDHAKTHIDATVRLHGTTADTANALQITYKIGFTKGTWQDKPTEFLMNPQIIYLTDPVEIEPARGYDVTLSYEASSAPLTAQVMVTPAPAA